MPVLGRLVTLIVVLLAVSPVSAEYRLETWAEGLDHPWSIAFLPDGGALLTERRGTLRPVSAEGEVGPVIKGVPPVYVAGQGGLFDVVLHPRFETNRTIFLSYAEGVPDDNGTAVARAEYRGGRLVNVKVIFRNFTRKDTSAHYGGRLAFLPDGSLLLTTGEGFDYREAAQDIRSGLGKVLRMTTDGAPALGNPFPESPYVYSYGHRNPQGLAVAADGTVWLHEHGPRGGDELNRIEPGRNYGWPAITHGVDYSGALVSPFTAWEGMEQPVWQWTPSIAPSGLAIYEGSRFPEWRGDLFVGALVAREVRRLEMMRGAAVAEQALFGAEDERVRDVRNGPGGTLYLLLPTRVLRVVAGP